MNILDKSIAFSYFGPTLVPCPHCLGSGGTIEKKRGCDGEEYAVWARCKECAGTGLLKRTEEPVGVALDTD